MAKQLSDAGLDLIKSFEGFRSHPYRDAGGTWTIGYGTTRGVNGRTKPVTRQQAAERLRRDVQNSYGDAVNRLQVPLTQPQYDALVSFVYNVGPGAISASTGIGRALRKLEWEAVPKEMRRWDKVNGVPLLGLTRRREAEARLFAKGSAARSGYTKSERDWMAEYDRLKLEDKDLGRRRVLRTLMKAQRERIERVAANEPHGWDKANRRARHASLRARTR